MMRFITIIVFALAALWGGWWFVGSTAEQRAVTAFFARQTAEGRVATYSGLAVEGFPSRFDLTVNDIALGDPAAGVTWRAPFAQLLALSYNPYHFIAALPHQQTLTTPDGTITVTSDEMRASLSFVPGLAFALDEIVVVTDKLGLTSSAGWGGTMDQFRFATRQMPDRRFAHEIGVEADRLTLSPAFKAQLDPNGELPATIEQIHLDAAAGFSAALDRHAARTKPRLTDLTIKESHLTWGDMVLSATGKLTFAADGTPEGRIDLRAKNWRAMIGAAAALGLIRPEMAPTWQNMLDTLAKSGGDPTTVDLPLEINKGWMSFGPLPLGPVPRLPLWQ
jgi:hypothetical protein